MIKPVFEREATEDVKHDYNRIKQSLHISSLPLFFAYLGVYPEYLRYITEQLVINMRDPQFSHICSDIQAQMTKLVGGTLPKKSPTFELIQSNKNSPEFHHFESQISDVVLTNIKLALVFVALREAVKGWAVAAKQLETDNSSKPTNTQSINVEDFIYEQPQDTIRSSLTLRNNDGTLVKHQSTQLTNSLLPKYMQMCRHDFNGYMHEEMFWITRLEIEKIILNYLRVFPHIIFSPINVVLELSKKYPHFPDLIYLLGDHFPTYAVQRMMFSMYMFPR